MLHGATKKKIVVVGEIKKFFYFSSPKKKFFSRRPKKKIFFSSPKKKFFSRRPKKKNFFISRRQKKKFFLVGKKKFFNIFLSPRKFFFYFSPKKQKQLLDMQPISASSFPAVAILHYVHDSKSSALYYLFWIGFSGQVRVFGNAYLLRRTSNRRRTILLAVSVPVHVLLLAVSIHDVQPIYSGSKNFFFPLAQKKIFFFSGSKKKNFFSLAQKKIFFFSGSKKKFFFSLAQKKFFFFSGSKKNFFLWLKFFCSVKKIITRVIKEA